MNVTFFPRGDWPVGAVVLLLTTIFATSAVAQALSVDGVPCKEAIAQARAAYRANASKCSAMLASGQSGYAHQNYWACDRETAALNRKADEVSHQCWELENQYNAWMRSSRHAIGKGTTEAMKNPNVVGNDFARIFTGFERAHNIVSAYDAVVGALKMSPQAPVTEKYSRVSAVIDAFADWAVPGGLPNFMFVLSAAGIHAIHNDALQQLEVALAQADDLARLDTGGAPPIATPFASPPYTVIAPPLELIALAQRLAEGLGAPQDGPFAWVAELQRAVASANATAAANQALAAERAEAARRRRASERAEEEAAEVERIEREGEEELRRDREEFRRMQENATGPLTFPTFQMPSSGSGIGRQAPVSPPPTYRGRNDGLGQSYRRP